MIPAGAGRLALVACVCLVVLSGSGRHASRLAAEPAEAGSNPRVVRFVSPHGSDANSGTIARPWRTLGKALAALGPGETAYLRAGEYVEATSGPCNEARNALQWTRSGIAGKPITVAAYPADRGRVIVRTQLKLRGDHLRLVGLVFERNQAYSIADQRCSGAENITIAGDDVDLVALDVRNSNMSGVYLREADGLRINRCAIHDNGTHPGQDHGVYVSSSSNLLIANTIIDRNAGYGIHIYPDTSRRARIVENTVVRNGNSGVIIANDSEDNVIANNIFAYNGEYGVRGFHELSGSGNRLVSNLFYGNRRGDTWFPSGEVETSASVSAPPGFVNLAAGDFRLRPRSAALDKAVPEYSRPLDYLGHKRPRGTAADLGALER